MTALHEGQTDTQPHRSVERATPAPIGWGLGHFGQAWTRGSLVSKNVRCAQEGKPKDSRKAGEP